MVIARFQSAGRCHARSCRRHVRRRDGTRRSNIHVRQSRSRDWQPGRRAAHRGVSGDGGCPCRGAALPSAPLRECADTRARPGTAAVGGWRIEGHVPDEPKLLLLGAPHTSYFDFVLTKLTAWAVGVRLSWVGKKSLFPGPIAPLVRWAGGIPVNRATSEGFVERMVEEFQQRDRFYLALMPEGGIRTSIGGARASTTSRMVRTSRCCSSPSTGDDARCGSARC